MRLAIAIGELVVHAELRATPTTAALAAALPFAARAATRGEEVYFGRTPLSSDARPKLASRCNVLGKLLEDARLLARVRPGDSIRVGAA